MKKLTYIIVGIILGIFSTYVLMFIITRAFPLITGSGSDEMTQGILGTLVFVFSAPVLVIIGAFIGYKKSLN